MSLVTRKIRRLVDAGGIVHDGSCGRRGTPCPGDTVTCLSCLAQPWFSWFLAGPVVVEKVIACSQVRDELRLMMPTGALASMVLFPGTQHSMLGGEHPLVVAEGDLASIQIKDRATIIEVLGVKDGAHYRERFDYDSPHSEMVFLDASH